MATVLELPEVGCSAKHEHETCFGSRLGSCKTPAQVVRIKYQLQVLQERRCVVTHGLTGIGTG